MENIHRFIEQTNLRPNLRDKDIEKLVRESKQKNLFGICVPPFWVKSAHREIGKNDLQLVTVIGFPLGYNMTDTKLEEMRCAIDDGANELDLVMNISAFKSGLSWTKVEMAKCAKLAHENDCLLKVIIETAYLDAEEIEKAAMMASDAGTDFVKTSTGFGPAGATLEDIGLLRKILPSSVRIKASGGIRSYKDAVAMIRAGADRIGTSSGVQIVESAKKRTNE
jgi:deoxyribose-phosphate aldolase